ncbi:unnamed protein product [Rotaria socialis]|uniref:Xanthine dehydrogenase n=2 Tax=Rotaria socialis TaxID=392032 RepID=A0A820VG80_9BILA|nr:unnamed protein product [Rotaria socialis]CAF4501218.1 unnamed protein product [Rotaria socialis]
MTEENKSDSQSTMIEHLLFYVNGKEVIERHAEPDWTLLWYLRNKLCLTGSKLGCGEGGCGACTVMISRCIDRESGKVEHRTINACLAPLCSVDGCHVITVEGLGSVNKSNIHPIQSRLTELFGSQCGFCTPGMVMSLYGTITTAKTPQPTLQDIEEALDGNLCRCTGYRPILDAVKTFASDIKKLPTGEPCATTSTTLDKCILFEKQDSIVSNHIDFPAKLQSYTPQSIHIRGSSMDWFRPTSLKEVLQLRRTYPGDASKFVFGNTRVQMERQMNVMKFPRLIALTHVEELQKLSRTHDTLCLGAGITFSRLKSQLIEWVNDKINDGGICEALLNQLRYFASTQIRNVASLGGNIITASPISDINPVLQAANAILELHHADTNVVRQIPLRDFFLGARRISMDENEVLVTIHIPLPDSSVKYFLRSYKQARRRDDSKGIVSAGFQVQLEQSNSSDSQWQVAFACFSFGGMGSTTVMAKIAQQNIIGLPWTRSTMNKTCEWILNELPLDETSLGGQPEYRRTLMQSFLFKFYTYICCELRQTTIDPTDNSIAYPYRRPISHAQQTIPKCPQSQKVVGTSLLHQSGYLQATGEATYVDDIPSLTNTLHAAFVLSTKPNARIKHIDIEAASQVPGFVSFVTHTDVPGSNQTGPIVPDEEIFVSSVAPCIGAVIGLVVCESEQAAYKAANLVQIEYELLTPTILTIEDAIMHESYFGNEICLQQGDIDKSLAEAEHKVEGTLMIGGQEHFYLEPNCCMVIPSMDDNEITMYLSTQSVSAPQELTARALGRDISRIKCHNKRVGGAFGGKETRPIPLCIGIAVAAVKVGRPVRFNLDRHTDISITGHRHPFKVEYKVGFTANGNLLALDIQLWNNGGCSLDYSISIMEHAMLHTGNCYRFPNIRIRGRSCKTHLPSNTALRGFGGPQGILASENIIEHIASYLKMDPFNIRQLNLFKEGDTTHYGQILEHWNVPRILNEIITSSDLVTRQKQVDEFNRTNIYRKRGISIIPTKFGIGFLLRFLNQAGALVHIYKDGSVLVSHGGIEMGQGLNTKMIAIAAEVLGCGVHRIRISETASDKVPNASSTGGSVSSDLNGMAVKHACEQLRERLNTLIVDNNAEISWENLVTQAYFSRLDLCAHGFHATPNMFDYDLSQNRAQYNYFTQGAAVSEVELDTLTGDWHILRVDILMDVGTSLNPYIDIGQIEGAFMQGVGLFTMEELIWGDHEQQKWIKPGFLFSRGPDTYKIPSFSDVPLDFRVSLLSESSNPRAIYSSKGIGEPPITLASSVFFALKQACMAYRKQQGFSDYFTLQSPATVERLRMACSDEFTNRACLTDHQNFQPRGSY